MREAAATNHLRPAAGGPEWGGGDPGGDRSGVSPTPRAASRDPGGAPGSGLASTRRRASTCRAAPQGESRELRGNLPCHLQHRDRAHTHSPRASRAAKRVLHSRRVAFQGRSGENHLGLFLASFSVAPIGASRVPAAPQPRGSLQPPGPPRAHLSLAAARSPSGRERRGGACGSGRGLVGVGVVCREIGLVWWKGGVVWIIWAWLARTELVW